MENTNKNTTTNTNTNTNINDDGLKTIKKMYNNLSYFDQYGSSVLLLIIITIVIFIMSSYCYVMINIQPIKDDWINQRCKPGVIPFAGLINCPDDMTFSEFTKQNFDYCTQNIVNGVTSNAVQPITFVTDMLNKLYESIQNSINAIRGMFNKIRLQIQAISEELMGRLMNIMIPLQQIIIAFKDILSKTQGALTAGLYTLLGSYYTLKSLMGAIAQLIITILIGLSIMIAALWLVPFTWGAAAANSAIFIAISIPMALVLGFMIDILKVKTNLKIPSIKCFDKDTLLKMNDGTFKRISEIETGDILTDNNEVTAKIKVVTEGSQMYTLNGVVVSDSHIVNYHGKWIPVSEYPDSVKMESYNEPFLYCLNTGSKTITINDMCFTDWDEIYDESISKFNTMLCIKFNNSKNDINYLNNTSKTSNKYNFKPNDIHKYYDGGFIKSTVVKLQNGQLKEIQHVEINEILENGEKVYGLVEINGTNLDEQFIYNLGKGRLFEGGVNLNLCDKSIYVSTTLDLDEPNKKKIKIKNKKLYHLLTDKNTLSINNVEFFDYNACIDLFLEKSRRKLLSIKYV
jgi:hypothetical protein